MVEWMGLCVADLTRCSFKIRLHFLVSLNSGLVPQCTSPVHLDPLLHPIVMVLCGLLQLMALSVWYIHPTMIMSAMAPEGDSYHLYAPETGPAISFKEPQSPNSKLQEEV